MIHHRRTLAAIAPASVAIALAVAPGPARGQDDARLAIGLFLAADRSREAEAREIGRGAVLAAELAAAPLAAEAGAAGARAFRVVAAEKAGRWEAGAGELVRLVYSEGLHAVLGPVDGRAAHVAEQVAARAKGRFVLLAPWTADPSLTRIKVPWFFRLAHDARLQSGALLEEIAGARGLHRVLVVAAEGDHDARAEADAFARAARLRGGVEVRELAVPASGAGPECLLEEVRWAEAVVLAEPPAPAARDARRLREAGVSASLFGFLDLAAPAFLGAAGEAAEGVVLAAPPEPRGPAWERFRAAYVERHGDDPGIPAAFGRDGALVLAAALRAGGDDAGLLLAALSRTRRDGSTAFTGPIEFDSQGDRIGPASLARVERGRLAPLHPPSTERALDITASSAEGAPHDP
ncbi:MAG: ABC transporter substrate-binding protein [Planctomycetes bacterium]|nr:ABC transporter substrate-binding protein [Planctomycetota bacterium]